MIVQSQFDCDTLFVSAKTGQNIDLLKERIQYYVLQRYKYLTYEFDCKRYNAFFKLADKYAVKIVSTEFNETCTATILLDVNYTNVFNEQFKLLKFK